MPSIGNEKILSSLALGLIVFNKEGTITYLNPHGNFLLDQTSDELSGKHIDDALDITYEDRSLSDEDRISHAVLSQQKAFSSSSFNKALYLTSYSGHNFPALIIATPIITKGVLQGGVVSIRDITIEEHRKSDLEETKEQLENRNREINDFFYKTSHDLQSPLSSSFGLINLMRKEFKNEEVLHYTDLMENSLKKLQFITGQLIEIARARQATPNSDKIDFEKIIMDTVGNIQNLSNPVDVDIKFEIKNKLPFYCDKNLVSSILQNIIENAVKYRRSSIDCSFVNILVADTNSGIKITVEDNGIGIDESLKESVFKMFFRASEDSNGSGLGLYIVKSTVEKLGGRVELQSEKSKGTTVTLFLPRLQLETSA